MYIHESRYTHKLTPELNRILLRMFHVESPEAILLNTMFSIEGGQIILTSQTAGKP